MGRSLFDVIDRILVEVPADEVGLRTDLEKAKQSALYAAPEIQYLCWSKAAAALNFHIPEQTLDWHKRVAVIFSGP
jgi:hypothetical protein